MSERVEIREKRWKDWTWPSWTLIVGKTGTGKSSIMKLLMYYHRRKFRLAMLYSETATTNPDFANIIHDLFIFTEFPEEKLEYLLQHQAYITNAAKRGDKMYKNAILDAIFLSDDCVAEDGWLKKPITKKMAYQFRHYRGSWIMCVQNIMAVPKNLRRNIRYLIITEAASMAAKKTIYTHFCNESMCSYQAFSKAIDTYATRGKVLIIDNDPTLKPEQQLCFATTIPKEEIPHFRIGSKKIWEAAKRKYNPKWEIDSFANIGVSGGIVITEKKKKQNK